MAGGVCYLVWFVIETKYYNSQTKTCNHICDCVIVRLYDADIHSPAKYKTFIVIVNSIWMAEFVRLLFWQFTNNLFLLQSTTFHGDLRVLIWNYAKSLGQSMVLCPFCISIFVYIYFVFRFKILNI